ncbi:type IIL restriction-modification enzyme MmeI [Corallococcus exercitus]|uniref:type IIL restriction-modification enzyme MmeI n=1 Tax=Corallococcus exercitus TaxID=2316736 RepID=UPI001C0FE56B|nr:type IIL restriction-modification enzyme MmeI [Corallococcus exercitus]
MNWLKGQAKGPKKLWFQDENEPPRFVDVERINSALSEDVDVTQAKKLHVCSRPEFCAQGQTHGHKGFLINRDEALRLLRQHPEYRDVLVPFLIGDDMIGRRDRRPSRYAIDFAPRTIFDSERFADLFKRVKDGVLEKREAAAKKEEKANKDALKKNPNARVNWHHKQFLEHWWWFSYPREALVQLLGGLDRYIACVRVTKRPIFEFVSSKIHPNDALQVFPFEDDYSFGILQSGLHWKWFTARCSTLKADPRYTSNTVFDTFPWPQQPTQNDVKKVAKAAVALRKLRTKLMAENGLTLRELYRSAEQPGTNPLKDAQEALDEVVADAYGMKARDRHNPLVYFLRLNAEVSELESKKIKVLGPGLPPVAKGREAFVTDDCIEP